MASTAGIAPAASTFARWRSDLTELRGQLASVIGLAPIRPGLKDRLLDLLCIHGLENLPLGGREHPVTKFDFEPGELDPSAADVFETRYR